MRRLLPTIAVCGVLGLVPIPSMAADGVILKTAKHPEYGEYLTDAEGRSVYLFEADTQGGAGTEPVPTCRDDCLSAWPPVVTAGPPKAGEGVDATLLGTVDYEGMTIVTYAGWPLYYYAKDTAPGDTKGHDIEEFGAEWYLLTPSGETAED